MSISKIAIIGAGGVGFWLTVALARNGRDERIGCVGIVTMSTIKIVRNVVKWLGFRGI